MYVTISILEPGDERRGAGASGGRGPLEYTGSVPHFWTPKLTGTPREAHCSGDKRVPCGVELRNEGNGLDSGDVGVLWRRALGDVCALVGVFRFN